MKEKETSTQVTRGMEKAIGQRFCTTCQNYRRLEDGEGLWKHTGKYRPISRWMCQVCVDKRKTKQ